MQEEDPHAFAGRLEQPRDWQTGFRQCADPLLEEFDSPLRRMVNVISDKIYIDFASSNLTPEIFRELTYPNPEFYQKMNMGISVYNIPKEVQTYTFTNGTLTVARGELRKIIKADPEMKIIMDHSSHPIDLRYVNNDFELDDYQNGAIDAIKKTRQGVVHAVTSAGKSLMIVKAICELGQRALIVVHRKLLMEQFLQDIEKYVRDKDGNKIKVGIIGGGKKEICDITIAIDKSLVKCIQEVNDQFGVCFLDECHLAPAATMYSLVNAIKAERRYGFSGTLKRKDEKQFLIFATFGRVIYTIAKEQLLDKERIVPVKLHILNSDAHFDYGSVIEAVGMTKAYNIMEDYLMNHDGRNDMILEKLSTMQGKTIVLSRRVEPCYALQKAFEEKYGRKSAVITGRDQKAALEAYNLMKHGDLDVIFATVGCVSTGVSISDLDNIILISPIYTNELLLHQIRGRLMRKSPGKVVGNFYFVHDQNVFDEWKLDKFINIINA